MTKTMIALATALLLTCALAFHIADPTARYTDPHPASPSGYSSCDPTNAPELCDDYRSLEDFSNWKALEGIVTANHSNYDPLHCLYSSSLHRIRCDDGWKFIA